MTTSIKKVQKGKTIHSFPEAVTVGIRKINFMQQFISIYNSVNVTSYRIRSTKFQLISWFECKSS